MIWGGQTVLVTWGYQPLTRPALFWEQDAAGYWGASDRGASKDVFESAVVFKGPLAELQTLETLLNANRQAMTITCGTGEEIFGADVNHSGSLSVSVVDYGDIERESFGQYSMPLKLRLLAPTFLGVTASLAALRLSAWRYGAFSSFDITKHFSIAGNATYIEHGADSGVFRGEFTQTPSEMADIRRYLLTTARGNAFAFPSFGGVTHPFGTRRGSVANGINCRVRAWEDLGRDNLLDWRLKIEFVEAP